MSSKESIDKSVYFESATLMYLRQRGYNFRKEQLGEPFANYKDFDACVAANKDASDPHAYCGKIKHQVEDTIKRELVGKIIQVSETLSDASFVWARERINQLRELSKDGKVKGKFILVEGMHPMTTDPFNVGHGPREWTRSEVMKAARTAVGKSLDLNHTIPLSRNYRHSIVDGEFNESTDTAEYIIYEEDPKILELIRDGYITNVSMNGQGRSQETVCDSCGTSGCSCKNVPGGVIFGETDGIGMAYVATKEFEYNGIKVKAERPGDWNSSLKIVETNRSQMQTAPLNRESLFKIVPEGRLKEALRTDESAKKVLKEDLQSFNDALASGDAVQAVSILANDLYRGLPDAKQSFPDPHPAGPESPAPAQKEDADAGTGMMPEQPAQQVPPQASKKKPEVDEKVKELTDDLNGDTRSGPGVPKKQTIPDEGIDNDNITMKDTGKTSSEAIHKMVEESVKKVMAGDSMKETIKILITGELAGMKESMKNLSSQYQELTKEQLRSKITHVGVKETLGALETAEPAKNNIDVQQIHQRLRAMQAMD